MNKKVGYIELVYENGWKKPIQVYSYNWFHGKKCVRHWFMEFYTFREAIETIREAHDQPIHVNRQIKLNI